MLNSNLQLSKRTKSNHVKETGFMCVQIKKHHGEVCAVFNKNSSCFALYEGGGRNSQPYQYSSRYHPDQGSNIIASLRNWLNDFDEGNIQKQ